MRKLTTILILFLLLGSAYAAEQIVDFDDKSLPVLNEEIRKIEDDIESVVPAGALMMWITDTAPDGWLLCYGQAVSRTTYARLFNTIGEVYGAGDSTTTFNVPDMRGRFPLGQDDMGGTSANRVVDADADALAGADGDETKTVDLAAASGSTTLTWEQSGLRAHSHVIGDAVDKSAGGASHEGPGPDGTDVSSTVAAADATEGHTHSQADVTGQDIMPNFITVNYIIKT